MSFIVVLGNSYSIKEELKQKYAFKFDGLNKVWYRDCLIDKFSFWQIHLQNYSNEIEVCWVNSLDDVSKLKTVIREEAPKKPVTDAPPHVLDGSIFEMSAWYAKAFKSNNNTAYAFRNLKILKVKRETAKALQVDAEFFSGIACSCGVCGRELNNDISRATGIGPVCAQKIGLPRPTMETAKEIVKQLESLSKAQGQFHDVWIPKSQIKKVTEDGSTVSNESKEQQKGA